MKRRKLYDFGTIRSKTMVLSKLAGGAIVLFYLVTEELPVGRELSFWIWFVLLVAVVMTVDYLLGKLISKPLGNDSSECGYLDRADIVASTLTGSSSYSPHSSS